MEHYENKELTLNGEGFEINRPDHKYFNTVSYTHVWWVEKENILVNQYSVIVNRSGKDHLLKRGLISETGEKLIQFEID